jgi:phage terminase large subunit
VPHAKFQAAWQTYRAMDFGYVDPLVCLWIQLAPDGGVYVVDEYSCSHRAMAQHAREICLRGQRAGCPPVEATYVDPAGSAKQSATGRACTEILAAEGVACSWRGSTIQEGLELIRSALDPADGSPPRLRIAPACRELIRAFQSYHYPAPGGTFADTPVKDGPDHCIDALRYFFVNRARPRMRIQRGAY